MENIYEEMIEPSFDEFHDEMKEKARKSRKARRKEKDKQALASRSDNHVLGLDGAKRAKRAWHKAHRREIDPCGSYKGDLAIKTIIYAMT